MTRRSFLVAAAAVLASGVVLSPPSTDASRLPRVVMLAVGGNPFGVVSTRDEKWVFVSELSGYVAAVKADGRRLRLRREIALPEQPAEGEAITPDGRLLLIATGSGATVVGVARAERGAENAVLGELSATQRSDFALDSAIEVVVSSDGRYAFVSLESADRIAVFDLVRAIRSQFRRSALVGMIPVGLAPVGMALSPNGRWLYATSEDGGGRGRTASRRLGTISVIDVRRAEIHPHAAVVASAPAGQAPVRVAVSPGGSTVWVTARDSNMLVAFSARRLRTDPRHAVLARVRVGTAPDGLALFRRGSRVIVADSNRFHQRDQRSGLTLVSTTAALAHKPAVLASLHAGGFPREIATQVRSGRVLVTNFASGQLEVVSTSRLP